jgi:hypothetical protein
MSAGAWIWLTMVKLMTHVEVWALLYLRQRSRSVTCLDSSVGQDWHITDDLIEWTTTHGFFAWMGSKPLVKGHYYFWWTLVLPKLRSTAMPVLEGRLGNRRSKWREWTTELHHHASAGLVCYPAHRPLHPEPSDNLAWNRHSACNLSTCNLLDPHPVWPRWWWYYAGWANECMSRIFLKKSSFGTLCRI